MLENAFRKLKHFDAYPKPLEDFRVKTLSGAFITVICSILIVTLFIYEWNSYMTVEVDQEIFVDLTRSPKLTINLDITFPRLHCSLLSLDAMDVTGDSQLDVVKGLKKMRLNPDGSKIKESNTEATTMATSSNLPSTETISNPASNQSDSNLQALDSNRCMSCYGGESSNRKCCNTCDEVRAAYRQKNWHFSPIGVEQCKQDLIDSNVNMQAASITKDAELVESLLKSEEGCRMYGHLEVNKVAGNFHIAPGVSYQQNHMILRTSPIISIQITFHFKHVHDVKHLQLEKFNTSHFFDVFSFGDEYPNQYNPLERKSTIRSAINKEYNQKKLKKEARNTEQMLNPFEMFDMFAQLNDAPSLTTAGAVSYNYFLKIVPTIYEYLDGRIVNNTYQYSVTKSSKSISGGFMGGVQLPGVYVVYELSPIMVKFVEKSKSFSHFITSCCAIIGGLFTIAGMLDAFTFRYYNMYKKYQINKLT